MINLTGEIQYPLEEFWVGVFEAIRSSGQDAGVDDVLVHPSPSLLTFKSTGEICGFIVTESELSLSPEHVSRNKPFVIQSDWLYQALTEKLGLAPAITVAFGRPRIENHELRVDFGASTEGDGLLVKSVKSQWLEPQEPEGVSLSSFLRDISACRDQFLFDWVRNNAKYPERYPLVLPKDNEGMWYEYFFAFELEE